MNKHKRVSYPDKIVRILLLQVFFFTQLNFSGIYSFSNTDNYDKGLRRTRSSEIMVGDSFEMDEITKHAVVISNALSVQIKEWLEGKVSRVDFSDDDYVVGSLADSLAELSISYGVEHQELAELTKKVIDNFGEIFPDLNQALETGAATNAIYITPWIRVAVETAIRENTTDIKEIKDIVNKIRETLTHPDVMNDAAVLLGLDNADADMSDPALFFEFVEYARLVIVQDKMEGILRNHLGDKGVEKYQAALGSIVQVGNLLQVSVQDVLAAFEGLVENISTIEAKVKELAGYDSSDYVTPWIMVGLLEGIQNNLDSADLVDRVIKLIEKSKNPELQEAVAVGLEKDTLDLTNHDDVIYLSLQAKAEVEQEAFATELASQGIGTEGTRKQLATYLYFLSLTFAKQGKQELVQLAKNSLDKIEGLLKDISELAGHPITIKDKEALPWVWLDMVLTLDQDVDLTVESVLRFANTAEGRYAVNALLDGQFNPKDVSHIALLAPLSQMVVKGKQTTAAPITEEELNAILADADISSVINGVIARAEEIYTGENIDVEKVKQALLFQVLKGNRISWDSYDWAAGGVINGLTDIELEMSKTAKLLLSDEDKFSVCSGAADIIRNLRTGSIDRTLPDAVTTPSGFGWKSNLYRIAATVLSAGIATGVFLAAGPVGSAALFKTWLAFLTYVNVKPIVELGITGLVDIFVPNKPLAEVKSIVNSDVPVEHSGIVFRQMIVLKEDQLSEKTLIEEWLKQRLKLEEGREYSIENGDYAQAWAEQNGGESNIKLAIVLDFNGDADGERLRQLAIERYQELMKKYPGIENGAFLFIRNRGNWQFEEGYNRKEGRIDDALAFMYKGINHPDTHLKGHMADLRARDRNGNIRILGGNFYIDGETSQLTRSNGQVVIDNKGNVVTEDRVDFDYVYSVENGKLYGAYGNVIKEEGEFLINEAEGYIEFKNTPYSTITVRAEGEKADMIEGGYGRLRFLIKDGMLYEMIKGVDEEGNSRFELQLVDNNPAFVGNEGRIMVDKNTGEIIKLQDGSMIRGNYIGLDLRRDPFEPLFNYIGGNIQELGINLDENGNITGVDEGRRMRYFFVIDEDTTLPPGSIQHMIAKFAHPDNSEYVIMQPALKNTNAYTSWFTRIDTLAREMLRFSEYTNWGVFGGVMYGKWGARVDEYYHQIVEKEVADPTARSEDERPTLAVPVVGLSDVFWGDEPKKTFYQFMARLKEWTIGDEQTLLKQYMPRMLWGIPYKIYCGLTGKEPLNYPKLSPQGRRMLTNLGRSIILPTSFATLLMSYFAAGSIPSAYDITGVAVSSAITTAIVVGTIMFLGKWLAPTIRDLREAGFVRSNEEGLKALASDWGQNLSNYAGILGGNSVRALTEFAWSTGLFIPFIWLKSLINWQAYREIRQADREARMVPRTAGVTIAETNRIESLVQSYRKLLPSPVAGTLAIANLAMINPMALLGFIPIGSALLFQPGLAYLSENTTESFRKAIEKTEKDTANPAFQTIGETLRILYQPKANETMANEQLERLYRLTANRAQRYLGVGSYKDSDEVWDNLTSQEKEALSSALGVNAEQIFSDYISAIYANVLEIERKEVEKLGGKVAEMNAFYVKAHAQGIINRYPDNENLVNAANEIFTFVDDVANLGNLSSKIEDLKASYNLKDKDVEILRKLLDYVEQ